MGIAKDPNIREKIIAKAWKDPAFKKKLLSNPGDALKEMGVNIPANANVKVVENTPNSYTFVLPASPANIKSLSEAELETVAAAAGGCVLNMPETVGTGSGIFE